MIIQGPNTPMKMAASTASVQSWLGEELETRGVDAVVYTRYILSIFQQDSFDLEQDPELCGTAGSVLGTVGSTQSALLPAIAQGGHNVKSSCNSVDGGKGTGNGTHQRHHHHHHQQHHCHHPHHHHHHQQQQQPQPCASLKRDKGRGRMKPKSHHLRWQTPEDLKKDAVVKCLQSVTEKDCGIEGLVEELCLKLKKVQEDREGSTSPALSPDATTQTANHLASQEKYSEAFPALSAKPKGTDIKLKGVWKSKTKRNNSTGSISAPSSDREGEPLEDKSASASVSRNSNSPLGFQGRQYQRAQSLPSSLSGNKNKSPTFVVPKYQGRKGHQGHRSYGHAHDKGNRRHHPEREWGGHGMEKGDGRFRNGSGRKKRDIYPEWYKESGEGMADLAHFDDGKDADHREDVHGEVFPEVNGGDNAVKEEEKLEEAVSTMAESLCRSIIEDWDDDKPLAKPERRNDGSLITEGDAYMIGNGDGLKEWRAGSTRAADLNDISMAPVVVDGPRHASLSIWEKNLVPGSPLCAGQREPWESDARSCLPSASSLSGASSMGATNAPDPDACLTSPKGIHDESAPDEASDTMSLAEELRVDVDQVHLDSAPISPRNAPIGTGRNPDSLLRICDHTHVHSLSYDPQGTCSQTGAGWDNSCDDDQAVMHSTPAKSALPNDQPFSAEEDSIVQGICIAQKEGSLFNISSEAHSLDMNNALWATYENKRPQVQPPKIVTWDEGIFSGCHPLSRVSAFIEGGVYGSPYSSRNNSQFNSCSTSPCNESSIRELWEGPQSREASSACSLECLLSPPQACGQSCPSLQDEQSVIEDSLVDSPKYLCSRSSSRFEFARSDAENSDDSSPHGTETDEMISEDEWADEMHKDGRESSKSGAKERLEKQDVDDVKSTRVIGGSLTNHPSSSAESHQGSSANSQLGFCAGSFGSGKGTVVSQHQPINWKKHDTLSVSPGTRIVKPIYSRKMPPASSSQPLMTSDLHFKPIQLDQGSTVAGVSEGLSEPTPFSRQYGYYQDQNQFESRSAYPQMPDHPDDCHLEDSWQVPKSTPQTFPFNKGTDQTSQLGGTNSKLSMPSRELFPDYPATCDGTTGPGAKYAVWSQEAAVGPGFSHGGQSAPGLWDGYGGGAGAGPGDPGGGPGDGGGGGHGYQHEPWSCHGVRPRVQYGYDLPHYPDEEELFLHEGLLVDQPLEVHTSHRPHNRHTRRGGSVDVCKEFLEGRCSSGLCVLSHDTSRVTCGQWLEGRCQRGALCQFMHGYTSNLSSQNSSRTGSHTGSTTPDDIDNAAWEHQLPPIPHASDWVVVPSNRESGNHGSGKGVPCRPRDGSRGMGGDVGAGNGGDSLCSLPIDISSKNR